MRRFLTALLVTAGLVVLCAADAAAWWNKSWSHRRKLTFDNSVQPENLTGFQVLVVLNSTRIDYAKTRGDGYDLRFVDANDSTVLDYEIEKWDELGTSYVWVRIPQVDASSTTDFIWMYYGNPSAPNVQSGAAVWAGYSMVQHLEEPFPSQHLDSTGNANNSSVIDVQTQASPLGKIDGADLFSSASADNVDVPDAATLDKGAGEYLLVEAWINTGNGGGQMIVSKENVGAGTEGEIQLWTTGGNASFWLNDGTSNSRAYGTSNVANGAWHYVVGRWYQATSTTEVFVDGVSEGSASDVLGEVSTTTPLVIGQEGDADRGFDFDGRIDEVRVTKALRSNNWIRAQYLSMSDIGAGLVGPFVTYGAEAAHCCDVQVTETATDVTVTAANRFRAVYTTTAGGSMERFYDLEEDPAASLDLAGGLVGTSSPWGLHNTGLRVSGVYYNTGINTNGPKLDLLESTPARVRLRQESFYQADTGVVLAGLKAEADHTVYGVGRTAVRWTRRATASVAYGTEFHETMIHALGSSPLNGWAAYFQAAGAAAGTGGDDFSLVRNETAGTPGARTDFLNILDRDWTTADGHLATADLTDRFLQLSAERINAYWIDTTGATILAGAGPYSQQTGERWSFLTYFKPATFGDHTDAGAISRSNDYRTPSGITLSAGSQWQDAAEGTATGGDFFNEGEGAYVFDLDPATGLTFAMDGSATTRHYPFFKIRRWQSFIETPAVTFDPDGAGAATPTTVVRDTGYRAAVKPVARSQFAQDLLWYSTLQDSASVTSPFVGNGTGTTQTGMSYADGRYGQGAVFNSVSDEIAVVVQPGAGLANIEFDRGRIEFWYKPNNAHTDNTQHYLFDIDSDNVDYNSTRIRIKKEADNSLTAEVADATGNPLGVTILSTNYSWRAGDWVHLALEWDSTDATDNIRAYMNGTRLVSTAVHDGVFTMSAETASGVIRIGNKAVSPGSWNADGIIDEFKIYSAPLADIGHGGLTSDSREYLATSSNNFPLALQPVDASARGPYLFFGFDSKPKGLNVSLATPGAGVTDNQVRWYFWNGTTWGTASPTDGTNSFKKTGTISWGTDWAGWSPYSMNGGPDLYYMMARLGGVSGYTTTPVERQIKTDILLFQYCNDVTTAAATFTFGVPAPTAVGLMSFAAVPADSSVTLEWQTGSELDNLGFHLYRGSSADGPWTRLTSSLIPGLGSSPLGQAYSWLDSGLANGTRYYYRLEDVDTSSKSTFHGPVSTVPSAPAEGGGDDGGADGTERGDGEPAPGSCPTWILAAAPDAVSPVCTKHGAPESVSLNLLSRSASRATLELHTGGFWTLEDASGTVRVFVPGLEFPADAKAPALPLRRALVEAVIGKQVHLVSAEAFELQSFPGLRPSAVGQAEMRVSRDGTVRPSRRSVAPRLVSRGLVPQEVARLVGAVFQGERKSAVVEITPVRFDGSGQKLVLAGRVRVKLSFAGVAEGEVRTGSGGRVLPPRGFSRDVLGQLHTSRRGLYAVRYEALFPTDRRGFSTSLLRLQRQGEAVPFHIAPSGPVFGPGSVLYFFAEQTATSTEYASEVAYELVRGTGLRMGVVSAAPVGPPVASASTGFSSFETNRVYQPGLLEAPDIWLWDGMGSGVTRTQGFTLSGVYVSSTEPARLVVHLQGGSESGFTADHHIRLSVNGGFVGEATFSGKRPYPLEVTVPASLFREGANELSVTNVGDTGVSSLVFLDRFEVSYPQAPTVQRGLFEGVWAESGTAEVSGLSGLPVILRDSGEPGPEGSAVKWLSGFQATPGSVRFEAEAGHRYVVVSAEGLLSPRIGRMALSTLRAGRNQADYLVIAPREFLEAATPLLERRRSQGLSSRAVSFEQIASEFGHGQPSAEAIRAFLSYAWHSWRRPSPRYVLLLGDATDDPQHFQATSWASPLPALRVRTSYLWTASDPALGAVNGEDVLPDLAIGRLPATTREQAEALVGKLLAWEDSGQGLSGNAVLVADSPDLGGDFEADVEDVRASFLGTRRTTTLKVRELGAGTRAAILGAFDEGASLVSYVGHGGTAVWASENVLNSWDTPSLLAQSRQPFLLTLNCLNGYFVAPNFEALSEALLKVEGRGAVAALSPSGLSLDGPAHQYHRAVMAELTGGTHARLGDAILAAQRTYAQTGLMPELLTVYQLLGDPATRIR